MNPVGPADPIGAQLRRIAACGFVSSLSQRSREGQAEYRAALSDLSPELLKLAVDRWIKLAQNKYFPLPGQLRAMVADELAEISRRRSEEHCARIRASMRAAGYPILAAD
jgi:hypothetical protein